MSRPPRSFVSRAAAGLVAGVLAAGALALTVGSGGPARAEGDAAPVAAVAVPRKAANPVTPGNFTGYGFDQCLTPDQRKMDRWLESSPFLAVGIYISGDSRACRYQPNLTPAWVRTQLAKGWRLLPITLGPQASCQPRFPRYGDDETIIPKPGTNRRYPKARRQGTTEATTAVAAAKKLGISAGSTLWYDLEGFDSRNTHCRESALNFLSSWTTQIRALGYVSGVYSSAGSGILALDNARVNRPKAFALPDQIWIARWDGKANTSTSYLRPDGWQPHARIKQYQGGHDETWGGVRINIDRNYLDVGRGSVAAPETHCGGVQVGFGRYERLAPATPKATPPPSKVKALQCLLQEQAIYTGRLNGVYTKRTVKAVNVWQLQRGFPVTPAWTKRHWVSLLSAGDRPVLKYGSAGSAVRRLQRALNATADRTAPLKVNGVFGATTTTVLKSWQQKVRLEASGVADSATWAALAAGKRR